MLKEKLNILPEKPGCYLMKNKDNQVIYVGKAKSLKSRVKSYFTGSHNIKTQKLVGEINDFEFIVTDNEIEALILENNLIKKYSPKYNILLKDDKQYPYLKITNEKHPRLLIVRSIKKDGGKYFGPYPNKAVPHEIKLILDKMYPLRKCDPMPKKECLYYHIGQCLAPCVFDVKKETTQEMVADIVKFLKGETKEVEELIKRKMERAAEVLDFESAKEFKDQLFYVKSLRETQKVDALDGIDRDVFGMYEEDGSFCIQIFFVRQGKLIERKTEIFDIYTNGEDVFLNFLLQFYDTNLKPKEILIPMISETASLSSALKTKIIIPQKGDKKKLLEMANRNAKHILKQQLFLQIKREEKESELVGKLEELLDVERARKIEVFDNSNIQGVDAVSAMVVFVDGKPSKKEYRKFKIKTVKGPDDYGSMKEVIRRRYKRLLLENKEMPDVIFVDGGIGQQRVAEEVIQDELGLSIPVFGIAKGVNHKTAYLVGQNGDIELPKRTSVFYFIERMQDEVHRFAIDFFRKTHTKNALQSKLSQIDGIGQKRKNLLLKHFGSMEKIKSASLEEMCVLGIPKKVAEKLHKSLNMDE